MHSTQEEWREIPGYEGLYEVSTIGRVRSLASEVVCAGDRRIFSRKKKACILSPYLIQGYLYANLSSGNKPRSISVHRLVALAFIAQHESYCDLIVNHKDCNKVNNNVENLEWVTPYENTLHANQNGRLHKTKKRVIDTEYGIVYNSIGDVVMAYRCKYDENQISKMLHGRTPNILNIKFAA